MNQVLFIKTSSLGDVVHQMPAVTDARRHFPQARLVWVVEQAFAPLPRLHPAVDQVIEVATRRWRSHLFERATWKEVLDSRRQIRSVEYDAVIDAQGLIRSAIIASMARGPKHGYDAQSIREPVASRFYDIRHSIARDQHPIARNRKLTALSLGYEVKGGIDFGLNRIALRTGRAQPYAMLLHATADHRKEWPEENWIRLGRELAQRGHDIMLPWGTRRERERSERIAATVPRAIVPEREPLDAVARLIAGAEFVIGVDTGLLHLAAALGVPRVGILGAMKMPVIPLGDGPMTTAGSSGAPPSFDEVIAAFEQMQRQP
ncbi:MAG: lipopolysaccharide heptosyltransferase I [Proteobacteria bacterium]|nr:lipopolysaccharide heptosyltransferase I [Pseudomonadota bacterium]